MRGGHFVRQWRLLRLVSRPGGLTVADGAREVGCSIRTVWRDLRAFQDAGLPLYGDGGEDGGRQSVWRVHTSFHDRLPFPIALDEVVALLLSERFLAAARLSPLGPALGSLVRKLRALLAPSALVLVDRMGERVGVRALSAKLDAHVGEHLPAIHKALAEGRALRLTYFSMSRKAETERRVDPYHLTDWNGGLYLIGYCHLRDAVRIFAVERIRAVAPLRDTFTVPADFDAEAYLADAWGLVRGDRVTVRILFAAAVAPYVRERLWHRSQTFRDRPDGRLELTLEVADTIEVRRWVLGFGGDAEVLEPASLRDAIRHEVERLTAVLASGGVAVRDGIVMDRKPLARRAALAPSRRASPIKRNRAGARRRA
jgi:predicted DNA-binding transcriptional regulator YafY